MITINIVYITVMYFPIPVHIGYVYYPLKSCFEQSITYFHECYSVKMIENALGSGSFPSQSEVPELSL